PDGHRGRGVDGARRDGPRGPERRRRQRCGARDLRRREGQTAPQPPRVRATTEGGSMSETRPTVVLVHGAFADASSWNGVIERLRAKGVSVPAPPNPLRGITADSAYIASVLEQTPGPVVLVGHSYGGAVITNAAAQADHVLGLVFVAA